MTMNCKAIIKTIIKVIKKIAFTILALLISTIAFIVHHWYFDIPVQDDWRRAGLDGVFMALLFGVVFAIGDRVFDKIFED